MAMRNCQRIQALRIVEKTVRFQPEDPTVDSLTERERTIWATCFWQSITWAINGKVLPKLTQGEFHIRDFNHMAYSWREMETQSLDEAVAFNDRHWASDETEVVFPLRFEDLRVVLWGNNHNPDAYSGMVAEFCEHFVEEQDPLKSLYLDFGYGSLETQMPTLAEPLTGMDQNMTRLYIGHLIEGFDIYLYQLLKWTAALAELKLVNCAMMRIRIGCQDPDDIDTDNIDQLEYDWRNVFELCSENLEFLNELFIDNLHYLPRPEIETRQVGALTGLTCGLPLYTTNTRDMRPLDHLRRQVQHPRIEADMGSSKWLDRFSEDPRCWEVLQSDGSLQNFEQCQ